MDRETKQKNSTVYLVGAGPGAKDLLTVRALNIIQDADVIVHDQLVSKEVLSLCPKSIELISVGKSKGSHSTSQKDINLLLLELSKKYKQIVRLKGGDPCVYGRAGEEVEFLISNSCKVQIVPGVTAAFSAAASAGISLTHRETASELVFHTGHGKNCEETIDFSSLNLKNTTHIIYMGLTRLKKICADILTGNSGGEQTPVLVVENSSLENETILHATLESIATGQLGEELCGPAIIIVGEIARQ